MKNHANTPSKARLVGRYLVEKVGKPIYEFERDGHFGMGYGKFDGAKSTICAIQDALFFAGYSALTGDMGAFNLIGGSIGIPFGTNYLARMGRGLTENFRIWEMENDYNTDTV